MVTSENLKIRDYKISLNPKNELIHERVSCNVFMLLNLSAHGPDVTQQL